MSGLFLRKGTLWCFILVLHVHFLFAISKNGGGAEWMKDGEEVNQRTFMHNPWTWTTIQGLAWRAGGGACEGGQREKKAGTTVVA